jgi:hypothetical protein
MVPLNEVVDALGMRGETAAWPAADPAGHDRRHARRAARVRPPVPAHFQPGAIPLGTAAPAQRRGEPIPAYRVGGLHFVEDGHHRVSIAAAAHQEMISAYVTEVLTDVPAWR